MVEITIDEITQDPLTYLNRVQVGESFVVLKSGAPIAQINPVQSRPKMTLANAIALSNPAILQEKIHTEALDINSDEIWHDVRDRTPVSDELRW
jgi:antitoxin (DNA-binding transcriptional repressor) of toxin-antitoxin stability system